MAIPISRLSQLLASCASPADMLVSLRANALVLETTADGDLLAVIRRAEKQTADEIAEFGFAWATPDTRIPGLLAGYGYLTDKGLAWLPRPLSVDELAKLQHYVRRNRT